MTPLSRNARRATVTGAAAVAAIIVACSDAGSSHIAEPPPSSATWSLSKVAAGDDLQTDTVLASAGPLRVVVRADGAPMSGVVVAWMVSGAITATDSTTTGSDGVASMNFAFGAKPGSYAVQAAVPLRPELAPLSFSGRALPGHAAQIRVVSGAGQSDSATAQLHDDFVALATDSHGNPTPGVAVDWTVTAGGGSISQSQTTSDSAGSSAARYTLGRAAGANAVTATLHGLDAKTTFQATASPANPAKLTMVSGNDQTAEAGHALASDYVVKVADGYDNPVAGVGIGWAIASGGGTLSASQVTTGADGLGATRLTLGSAISVQSVNASLASWPKVPVAAFSSTATPPPPPPPAPTLVLVSGGGQSAVISTQLPAPIVFRALDATGQPLAGKTITFAAPGTVAPASANSDAQGFVQTTWTLGPNAGLQTIVATAAFTTVVGSANAIAVLPPLAIVGDPVDAPLPVASSIGLDQFTDAAVAPASLVAVATPVTVTVSHGPHTSVPPTVTIPAGMTYGRFRITAASAGTDTIVASAPGFTPATFIATVGLGTISFFPSQIAAGTKVSGSICIAAPDGEETFVSATTSFSLAMSPNISIASFYTGDPNTPVTSVGFPIPGGNCFFLYLKGISAGPATLTISSPIYKSLTTNILVTP